jgi:hypothetical protein
VTSLAFLAIPVVIITIGCVVIWVRSRKPNTLESGIDSFQREMNALSPEQASDRRTRRGGPVGGR